MHGVRAAGRRACDNLCAATARPVRIDHGRSGEHPSEEGGHAEQHQGERDDVERRCGDGGDAVRAWSTAADTKVTPAPGPLGTLGEAAGTIGANGSFSTTYTAAEFAGRIRVTATIGTSVTKHVDVAVAVPGLRLLVEGDGYLPVGGTTKHPRGWYGTPAVIGKLKAIAKAYRARYFSAANPRPQRRSCSTTT